MGPDADRHPLALIAMGAAAVGVLLLLAPWTPPQLAVFGFVGLFVLGAAVYVGVGVIADVLRSEADRRLPEEPEAAADRPVDDEVIEAYVAGEIDDEELEAEIERALRRSK